MGDRVKAFWLGIFIIVGIAIAAWLIMFLKPSVGDGKVTLNVRFSNIGKVEEGTRVTFAGKPVGEVHKIVEVKDPRQSPSDSAGNLYIYELTLKVDSSVQVYTYDEILFATSGLLGEKSIAINPKATPPGAPPAENVTDQMLFARSTDKLDEALTQLTQVAESFDDTLSGVNEFFSDNAQQFNDTLTALGSAGDKISTFLGDLHDQDFVCRASRAADALAVTMDSADLLIESIQKQKIVNRLGKTLDNVTKVTGDIANGQGTLGKLITQDDLYWQITNTMCRIETLINDINCYGLLFQYNKKWQRQQRYYPPNEEN